MSCFSRNKRRKIEKNQDGGLKVPCLTFTNVMFRCQNYGGPEGSQMKIKNVAAKLYMQTKNITSNLIIVHAN